MKQFGGPSRSPPQACSSCQATGCGPLPDPVCEPTAKSGSLGTTDLRQILEEFDSPTYLASFRGVSGFCPSAVLLDRSTKQTQQIRNWIVCEQMRANTFPQMVHTFFLGPFRILPPESLMALFAVNLGFGSAQRVEAFGAGLRSSCPEAGGETTRGISGAEAPI